MIKERCSKLRTRIDDPSKIIKKIIKNAYKLKLPDENNILPTFNVKDLRPYHGVRLEGKSFFPTMGDCSRSFYNKQWEFDQCL